MRCQQAIILFFLNIDPTPAPPLNGRGTSLNKVLALDKAKKSKLSFAFVLAYAYLCN